MEDKRPLLSICIPTYNRGQILANVLDKYVHDKDFDDSIELIISDNRSTDSTQEICLSYAKMYPHIHYYRNKANICDKNFYTVLDYATGHYLKLMNDCLYPIKGSLAYMKEKIQEHVDDKKAIFFSLGYIYTDRKSEIIECADMNDYILSISTFVTCNNCFGAWKEQWDQVQDKSKYADLKLMQDDWSYQIVANNNGCILYDKPLFEGGLSLGVRKGYNWFQVHLDNYYQIMMPYIQNGQILHSTFVKDKYNLLYHFRDMLVQIYIYRYDPCMQYDTKGTFGYFWKYYKTMPIFYFYLITYPVWLLYFPIKIVGVKILIKIIPASVKSKLKALLRR